MQVNKLDYLYRTLVVKSREQHNETVDISDEEYEKYYVTESGQVDPIPGSDIPIPGEDENEHDYSKDYLTFEAIEDGTFSFTLNDLYYSINNGASWKSLAAGTETELIKAGTKVLWKRDTGLSSKGYIYDFNIGKFSSSNKFNISGNILSLFYINNFYDYLSLPKINDHQMSLYYMFSDCKYLISAKNLILPTNLTIYCFDGLFSGCISLIEIPDLSVLTLVEGCYRCIFYNCKSLNYIKMYALNKSPHECLTNWVYGVAQSGTFIKNSKTNFNIGSSGIPAGWEVIDEVVPEE